jgi:CheY-like chemotaxis protein
MDTPTCDDPHDLVSGEDRVMQPSPAAPRLTIILVEDEPVDVSLIRWVLDAHDLPYELQVIDNGDRAAEVVHQLAQQEQRRTPTVILLDLHLLQRDGKDLLRQIKAMPRSTALPVVVVTGDTNPRERAAALELGADGFFVKPFHLTQYMELGELIKSLTFEHAIGRPPLGTNAPS